MNIYEKLAQIQKVLKAPKNAKNEYGNYKYRTIESINEEFKKAMDKYKVTLTLTDELVLIGDRFYIKSTATLRDFENVVLVDKDGNVQPMFGETSVDKIECVAYAREPNLKKGMDESQITGTASTYARKYALQGLLLLDNSADDPDKTAGEPTKCANCGSIIEDEALIDLTMKRFKKPICKACIDKKREEVEKKKSEKKPADIPDAELPFQI